MDDLPGIHKLHSNPEVDRYNTLGIPDNMEVTTNFFEPIIEEQTSEERTQYCWSVFYKSNDQFIGLCGMRLAPERFKMSEIYFNIHPKNGAKGLALNWQRPLLNLDLRN